MRSLAGVGALPALPWIILIPVLSYPCRVGAIAARPLWLQPARMLARPLRCQLDNLVYVILRHKTGASHDHVIGNCVEVRPVQRQQHNGQIALEILLLVNSKEHLTIFDGLQNIGREIKGSQLDLPNLVQVLESLESRCCTSRPKRQNTINTGIMLDRCLDSLLGLRRVVQIDANLLHRATGLLHCVGEALTTLLKGGIANLLVDTKRML